MSDAELLQYTSNALWLVLRLSLPVIAVAALIGLLIGLFQALTQIQDQTFSFVFKLIGVIVTIIFTAAWAGSDIRLFAEQMFNSMPLVPR